MHRPSRPDGSTTVTEESEGDPPSAGAAGDSAQTSQSNPANNRAERSSGRPGSAGGGEPRSPSWCKTKVISRPDRRGVCPPLPPRRSSSGYFSNEGDSVPSSPLTQRPVTADKATQTPSPSAQVLEHALQRLSEAHDGGPWMQHESFPGLFSSMPRYAAGDMQAVQVGRELRHIGDDFNEHILRRVPDGYRRAEVFPNHLPHIHQEPTLLIFVGLLLFLIGRYFQDSTNSHQDNPQV